MKRFGLSLLLAVAMLRCNAQTKPDVLAPEIERQIRQSSALMNFPKSAERFYRERQFASAWVTDSYGKDDKWQAMLLIDCVLQYGLSPSDYHPKELTYDKLNRIAESAADVNEREKARFDIMLTDAMITMINYLHYGKLNPDYGQQALDYGWDLPLYADRALEAILLQPDFKSGMLNMQPQSRLYADLQYKMRQLKGLYDGDCYEVPEATIRKIAINMERLRWAEINDDSTYVQINIPSFKLTHHTPALERSFKVIVGSPATPTPVLKSRITYFTTAPEWKVPEDIFVKEILPKAIRYPEYLAQNDLVIYDRFGRVEDIDEEVLKNILKSPKSFYVKQAAGCDNTLGLLVFHFENIYSIYLQDTPDKSLFSRERRDLSYGCIRVEDAAGLAALLLENDQQNNLIGRLKKNLIKEKHQNFVLNKPLPVKITYLTCLIRDGEIINYQDIYNLDKSLEMALYNVSDVLSLR